VATENGERLIKRRRRRKRRKLKLMSVRCLQVWQRTYQAPGNFIHIFQKYLKGDISRHENIIIIKKWKKMGKINVI
jgi:hypothetical protein